MTLQDIADALTAFVRENPLWAFPVVFLLAFGESLCIVSLVLPATFMLVAIVSVLAAGGTQFSEIIPAIVFAGLGGSLGYACSYWIGLYLKDRVTTIWPFTTHPRLIPRGQRFFEKYGFAGVFLGHFFGPIRGVIPLAAGMFSMKQSTFQVANVLSAFIWAIGVMAPFFFLVEAREDVGDFLHGHAWLVALAMGLIAFVNAVPNLLLAVPSLLLFLGLGAAFVLSGGHLGPVLIASAIGAFAGDLLFYWEGKQHNADFSRSWLIDADPEDVIEGKAFLKQHGAVGIVASKFLGMKRCLVPVISGLEEMPAQRFLPVSAVSSVLWAGVLIGALSLLPLAQGWLTELVAPPPV